jgi:hypothetical protein
VIFKIALKTLLIVAIALWGGLVVAQQMEIIELKSKNVDQVLPVLLPLVESGGTLTGVNNQLFLRASPRNRAEIKKALAAIDTPTRRLIIRISQNRENETSNRGVDVGGQIVLGSSRRSHIEAEVWDTKSVRSEKAGQMIQTIDGGQAFIQIGRSLPIPMRQVLIGPGGAVINETVVYRDVGHGFYAVPHLIGKQVMIEISQQADSFSRDPGGVIHSQRLSTTVSGRLGDWIELGGSGQKHSNQQNGGYVVSSSEARRDQSVWLKVEEID